MYRAIALLHGSTRRNGGVERRRQDEVNVANKFLAEWSYEKVSAREVTGQAKLVRTSFGTLEDETEQRTEDGVAHPLRVKEVLDRRLGLQVKELHQRQPKRAVESQLLARPWVIRLELHRHLYKRVQ